MRRQRAIRRDSKRSTRRLPGELVDAKHPAEVVENIILEVNPGDVTRKHFDPFYEPVGTRERAN
jgi:hypothetical protein